MLSCNCVNATASGNGCKRLSGSGSSRKGGVHLEPQERGSWEAGGQAERCSKLPRDFSWEQALGHWLPTNRCTTPQKASSSWVKLRYLTFLPQNKQARPSAETAQ